MDTETGKNIKLNGGIVHYHVLLPDGSWAAGIMTRMTLIAWKIEAFPAWLDAT